MGKIDDFNIKSDKKLVLDNVDSYFKIQDRENAEAIYDKLLALMKNIIKPLGLYRFIPIGSFNRINELKDSDFLVLCIVTIGNDITRKINDFFDKNLFLEGLIFDALASDVLFNISDEFYLKLSSLLEKKKYGLTCRIAPGDGILPLEAQKFIVDSVYEARREGITMEEGFVVKPQKSLTYLYGAGKNVEPKGIEHTCITCTNEFCSMRDLKLRGNFSN